MVDAEKKEEIMVPDRTEVIKGKEVFLKKMPSGEEYGLRKLTYRERKNVMSQSAKIEFEGKTPKQSVDLFKMQMLVLAKSLVVAPWLKENEAMTEDKLDNIKNEDANLLDKFADSLNFPKSDELE